MSEHDWLDNELGAVARDDAHAEVPPHVEAAVMRAWDTRGVEARASRGRQYSRRTWAVAAGLAAAVLTLLLVRMAPEAPTESSNAPAAHAALQEPFEPFEPSEPQEPQEPLELQEPQEPLEPLELQEPQEPQEFILVPDPFRAVTPMHLVRARMSRGAFATLGLPIGVPDADGLVEVEMLVGDDGVARTIRRATFVDAPDGGVQR